MSTIGEPAGRGPSTARPGRGRSARSYAVVAGVLFIVATVASLASQPFLASVDATDFLGSTAAHPGQVALAALLTAIAGLASTGIAVALYPVLRRHGEGLAIGAVGFRVIEGMTSVVGATVLLSLISVSRVAAQDAHPDSYRAAGEALRAEFAWLGNVGLVAAFSIGGLLYYVVFYRARLVPRWLSVWGIVGVLLLMAAVVLSIFGVIGPLSATQVVLAVPIGLQELVLAVWLIVKGFPAEALADPAGG